MKDKIEITGMHISVARHTGFRISKCSVNERTSAQNQDIILTKRKFLTFLAGSIWDRTKKRYHPGYINITVTIEQE